MALAPVVAALTLTVSASAAAPMGDHPSTAALERAIAEREAFGLSPDKELVRSLLGSTEDIGSPLWGIPMTAEEEARIDPLARMQYANHADQNVLEYARKLPTFAGAYIDQGRSGRLVIMLTVTDPVLEDNLAALAPDGPPIEVGLASTSFSRLKQAYDQAWADWPSQSTAPLYTVTIDERQNLLRLGVAAADSASQQELALSIGKRLGVPVAVVVAEPSVETTCTHPDLCYSPMKAGTRIRKGATNGSICSMAFHIINPSNGDLEFLTAGHCGYSGANDWFHVYYGLVGEEVASQYQEDGRDVMRVEIPNSQVSNNIYERVQDVEGRGDPIDGEFLCARLGKSNKEDCGFVQDPTHSWEGDACGCTINGAQMSSIAADGGDSGSPIYRLNGASAAIAIGVLNTDEGGGLAGFARLDDALSLWGWSVYTID